ncbi:MULTISPECIES: sigma-70 family RNA polymerase sigma factor [Pseudoxanthomonas]|uniref:RNA polymerase sigma factor (Sigma-70 family) n=1 Tax=Pseudoxanthomonas winnipegensis TaxID=2480810 RepID=A0AAW8GDA8_9GAMM|nr:MULTISPECIES: sigma-70 family RNA polymerase sigma factor [Pseudoxanthomonas]MDQ1120430.1 RNA polymerase sigma factor (sigma-70 family) [Pseudoxanthomonas winnipegensis]MDQ1133649.1 RNA polymerase sigma factor (sigma-70 family) [Pseudoxanthomonas winnipegensis]MDR6140111.1 RNA polymerase sigma factor (sigma-70 family) [Pseudoxanthomonas sp. SORGH_AS_0997]
MAADLHRTIDTLWRMEASKVLAVLTRMLRDIDQAEELAQDALVAALEHWPREGLPDNPAAWWMATAKRRAIDRLRQRQLHQRKHADIAFELEGQVVAGPDSTAQLDDAIGDDLLRLMFIACHPVLPADSRVVLTLRLLGGLSTAEIARAFLQPEPTVAQRIVRAKRTLAAQQVAFEAPAREDLPERVDAVLDVLYLIFNEGYSASAGEDWMRPALCTEALRLGRVLAGLMPRAPEVFGLLALMELQASRTAARALADGTPVLLEAQDRARWDRLQIARGLQALERAVRLGGADAPYTLQAAIAACHARALRSQDTDWPRIAALYARLAQVAPSPVIELNRAVALGRAAGAQAGLALADTLIHEAALREYPALPAVRGDLLERLGRLDEARACFEQAAALTRNAREAEQMRARAAACVPSA